MTCLVALQVKLFAHPCVAAAAPHYAHPGHSAHVTCVRWSACGRRAVSVGGADRAVFLWRTADVRAPAAAAPVDTPWAADPGVDVGCFWRPSPVAPRPPSPPVHAVPSSPRLAAWK